MYASQYGHRNVVNMLIQYGANVKTVTKVLWSYVTVHWRYQDGVSVLMVASSHDHCDIVKILHEAGSELDRQANDGMTALMFACDNSSFAVAKYLLQENCSLHLRNKVVLTFFNLL